MYVQLTDKGSIFHDSSQNVTITGTAIVEVKSNKKVAKAIKDGVIKEVKKPKEVKSGDNTDSGKSTDYTKLKKAELHALLKERNIDYDEDATNKELVDLLVANDSK